MSVNDGGPAFPIVAIDAATGQPINGCFYPGMSLRDYFASQVVGLAWAEAEKWNDDRMRDGSATRITAEDISVTCYDVADAMLAAREKAGGAS